MSRMHFISGLPRSGSTLQSGVPITTRTGGETVDTDDDSGIDLLWGIAVGYDLSSAWSLDLELQRIELDEPTDVIGLQAQWRIHSF